MLTFVLSVPKRKPSGRTTAARPPLLEPVEDDAHEEVGRLAVREVVGEVAHDVFLLTAAVWRIHEDLVELVFLRVVEDIVEQAVAVVDVGVVDAVQQQVRDGEHVGELLLLDAVDGVVPEGAVVGRRDLLLELAQPADEEAAGAAGEVGHALAEVRLDAVGHEVGDGARRVEFTGAAGRLQLFEDGLVDIAEGVHVVVALEIDIVDDVDDLTQQDTVLHVLVRLLKHRLDDALLLGHVGCDGEVLEHGEEVVDEFEKLFTRIGRARAVVVGPVLPAVGLGDDGVVVVFIHLPVLFFGIVDLEEECPDDLLDALGVAVDAGVVAHDVLEPFDESA